MIGDSAAVTVVVPPESPDAEQFVEDSQYSKLTVVVAPFALIDPLRVAETELTTVAVSVIAVGGVAEFESVVKDRIAPFVEVLEYEAITRNL